MHLQPLDDLDPLDELLVRAGNADEAEFAQLYDDVARARTASPSESSRI